MISENINNNTSANSDEISIKELILKIQDWLRYLLSKWWIIVLMGITGGALGFAYAYLKKPAYIATTTFVLESGESGGGLGQYAGIASAVGVDIGGGGGGIFQGDNILELYKSRTMIEKALLSPFETGTKEQLINKYIEINGLKKKWTLQPELLNLDFSANQQTQGNSKTVSVASKRLRDSVMGAVVEDIRMNYLTVAKLDKKLNIIKVEVKTKDEQFAKSFNDALVKNVNEFYIQTKTKKSLDNVLILQHKADSVRSVMNGAIYSSVIIADATPNLNPTRQVQRVAPVQRAQFSAETSKAILAELVKNLEMSKMSLVKETPLIQVVDQPIFPLVKEQLGRLKGMIVGAFLLSFISIFLLSLKMIYENILSSE